MANLDSLRKIVAWIIPFEVTRRRTNYSGFDDPELLPIYKALAQNSPYLLFLGSDSIQYSGDACLLPGIYQLSWREFEDQFGGGSGKRKLLLEGLRIQVAILAESGCKRVYVGGSFASKKKHPGDFEAVYDPEGVDQEHLRRREALLLMEREEDAAELKRKFGGVVEPLRIYPSLGFSMLEVLQFDTRRDVLKGVVEIVIS